MLMVRVLPLQYLMTLTTSVVLSTQAMLSTTSQSLVMFLTPLSILMLRLTLLLARPLPPLIPLL